MAYFVTGATGFIGRYLVKNLLKREGKIYVLSREASLEKVTRLRENVADLDGRVIPIVGDLTQSKLGISESDFKTLTGEITHFIHLAAIYDLSAGEEEQVKTNIEGTRNAVKAAKAMNYCVVRCIKLISIRSNLCV